MNAAQPLISVVLVMQERPRSIVRTLRHLRAQTIAGQIELILVGPDAASFDGLQPGDTAGFAVVRTACAGRIDDVDKSSAHGIRAASCDVIALIEDHAYPEPRWAAAMLEAHAEGDWAAVGSVVLNANPDTACSWSNQLLAYGEWTQPVKTGVTGSVSRHNISFKRDALLFYMEALEKYLGRGGSLLGHLKKRGYRFYIAPDARIRHANPSRFGSSVVLRFCGGRLGAATRAKSWPIAKRLVYGLAAPLIPVVRGKRIIPKLLAEPNRAYALRVMPMLLLALLLDGMGQMIGFLFGPGRTEPLLAAFEYNRMRHMTAADAAMLSEGGESKTPATATASEPVAA
jgi:hypothetical protein